MNLLCITLPLTRPEHPFYTIKSTFWGRSGILPRRRWLFFMEHCFMS